MKNLKNAGLILLSLLTVAVAVLGIFGLGKAFHEKDTQIPTPEPVEVETEQKTEETGKTPEETPEPAAPATEIPESPEGKALREKVERVLANMTLREKIGQMFIVDLSQLGGSNNTAVNQRTTERLHTYPVGGILLDSRNIVSNMQVASYIQELQDNADMTMFIVVEEEGGDNSVLASNPNMEVPEVSELSVYGNNRDLEGAGNAAAQLGTALKELGFNLNLAPVADVITNDNQSVLQNRSFGTDAQLVSQMVEAQVTAYQGTGISAALKYFPGYGGAEQSTQNGYAETVRTREEMNAQEWLPYMTGIRVGVDCVMMSNMAAPALTGDRTPCSLSKKVVTDILRGELGYNGMVLTGPLNEKAVTTYYSSSEAVLKAIDAGADVMFLPGSLDGTYAAVESAVKNGTVSMDRIDQSVSRILAVKIVRGLIDPEEYPMATSTPDPDDYDSDWDDEDEEWSDEEEPAEENSGSQDEESDE